MIIVSRPPNFELIHKHFPGADGDGVLFAYDGNIYNPSGRAIPPALVDHETVHLLRQGKGGADGWWHKYIHDSEFRYNEELLAHVAELRAQRAGDRNFIAGLMMRTALRLTAPLYNYLPPRTMQQALKDLRRELAK